MKCLDAADWTAVEPKSEILNAFISKFLNKLASLLFIAFCFFSSLAHSNALGESPPLNANIKFRNVDHQKLVEIGQIWAINEDSQGFIWLSGARGAARFDGLNIKVFQNNLSDPYSIPEGYVADILRSKSGTLWFASHKGLLRFDAEKERFIKIPLISSDGVEISRIWSLEEGLDGSIWLAFTGNGLGNYNPKSGVFEQYRMPDNIIDKVNTSSYAVLKDQSGYIWIGGDYGLARYDPIDHEFQFFRHSDHNTLSITPGTVTSLCEDRKGNIWVGTSYGLNRIDPTSSSLKRYTNSPTNRTSLSGNNIGDIVLDHQGQIWVVVDGSGLNLYNDKTDTFTQILSHPDTLGSLKSNSTRKAYISSAGDFWVGYHPHGIAVSDRFGSSFEVFVNSSTNDNSLSNNTINALFQSKEGELWLGTEKGVNHIDLRKNKITRYSHIPNDPSSLSANPVLTVLVDSSNRLWAGTWGGGLNLYDFEKRTFTHILHNPNNPFSLPSNRVWVVKERDQNTIWVGTEGGLAVYDVQEDKFTKVDGYESRIGNMFYYDAEHMLIVDDDEMTVVNNRTLKRVPQNPYWSDLERVLNAHVDKSGALWVNTEHGFRRQKTPQSKIEDFSDIGELAHLYYSQILTDAKGDLWLGNSHGITSFNQAKKQFSRYSSEHGLPGDSFRIPRATALLSDGRVAMGGAEGLVIFHPDDVVRNDASAQPVLTGLKILDQKVTIGAEGSPLNRAINLAKRVTLTYEQNVFSIEYSALDFQLAKKTLFSFRLKGFDIDWRNVGTQRVATYTNMDPGRYMFEVKAADDQEQWGSEIASVEILVLPPWWRTWWAYTLYSAFALLIAWLLIYVIWSKHQRDHERKINIKLKEIDKLKDDFMAKTSHELRTPLNGIIGLTETVIEDSVGQISDAAKDKLRIVVSSGKRLSNIINDILDFSKFKDHEIALNLESVNLYQLVESTRVLSRPLVGKKRLVLINEIANDFPHVMADEQRLNQILFNLVGNAIKFTDEGRVVIRAEENDQFVVVHVSDTGMGIAHEDQERIFEPFEQSLTKHVTNHFGTGLGLAVTKKLVELHGGDVRLDSQVGSGSTFSFTVSKLISRSGTSNPVSPKPSIKSSKELKAMPAIEAKQAKTLELDSSKQYKILIVDDEPVNRMVLEGYLGSKQFKITEAGTGREALDLIFGSQHFDLVLLDVMMPGLSGYDVCEQVRKRYDLCDLPIIFLTAKSRIEDLQRGYESGANDFLYKPVIREEFLAKVQIHLHVFQKIHERRTHYKIV